LVDPLYGVAWPDVFLSRKALSLTTRAEPRLWRDAASVAERARQLEIARPVRSLLRLVDDLRVHAVLLLAKQPGLAEHEGSSRPAGSPPTATNARDMEYCTTKGRDTVTLQVSGELDALTVPEIRAEIDRIVADGEGTVVVDLTSLRLVDSSGVGAIVSLFKRVRAEGRRFEVRGVQGQPLQIFQVLRLDQVFRLNER
jgi:anti-sigma B factor antagonist